MKKIILAAGILACIGSINVVAQEEAPKGKAIVHVFSNFHTGFGSQNDERGFDLDRAYLGYRYDLEKGLSVKVVMDMGAKSDDNDRTAYIKNAGITWKKGAWTLDGGLVSTTQFNFVEKQWGYRYIYKSFQDQYKFGSSADLGLSVAWKAADWLSLDAIVMNGEGYKKVQLGDGLQYGIGATLTPLKGLSLRFYAGLNEQVGEGLKDVMNYAAFIGYKADCFSIGAEYNIMENYKGVKDHNKSGFSVYGTLKASKVTEIFARYDDVSSKDDWAKDDDEGVMLLGAQFKLGKYVKLAPNFRMAMPKADGADNLYAGYISCYFGL